jgi:lysophospholipase L1-like esterase
VLGRFEQHVAPFHPQIVIVEVGINDLKTIPLFPDQEQAIVQNCQANISAIVTKSRNLGATVILVSIFPVGQVPLQRRFIWSDRIPASVNLVNQYLTQLQAADVILFDASLVLAGANGQLKPEFSQDELHLNAAGYDALNRELSTMLLTLTK